MKGRSPSSDGEGRVEIKRRALLPAGTQAVCPPVCPQGALWTSRTPTCARAGVGICGQWEVSCSPASVPFISGTSGGALWADGHEGLSTRAVSLSSQGQPSAQEPLFSPGPGAVLLALSPGMGELRAGKCRHRLPSPGNLGPRPIVMRQLCPPPPGCGEKGLGRGSKWSCPGWPTPWPSEPRLPL